MQQNLLFFENIFTYSHLLRPTRLLISAIFLSPTEMRKSTTYTTLLRPTRLLFFVIFPTDMFIGTRNMLIKRLFRKYKSLNHSNSDNESGMMSNF